ncbi:MAG: NTP transferase domain-containing protein [Nibricoccus sp.]
MQPALLVLAAGMGSRYGGLKQIDPVGPNGETILDYSVFDALRAGFNRVVFVIRRDFEALFREKIGAKYAGRIAVDYVFQSLDALPQGHTVPAGREKPWGTGHAAWCAKDALRDQPFAVINADDFYGSDSFAKLADFLNRSRADEAAMAGFQLVRTLSENGAVSRGVCEVAPGNILLRVTEQTGILPAEVGENKTFKPNTIVSMNCWGFHPQIFPLLDARFRTFLETTPPEGLAKSEFYLPAAISALIAEEKIRVRVLSTDSDWFGVTYRDDRPRVVEALNALIATGAYPGKLF